MCRQYGRCEEKELRSRIATEADEDRQSKTNHKNSCEYEVERLVDICYGDPNDTGKRGLKFKVNFSHMSLNNICLSFEIDKHSLQCMKLLLFKVIFNKLTTFDCLKHFLVKLLKIL